jgi:hypothetical protein
LIGHDVDAIAKSLQKIECVFIVELIGSII